MGERLLLLEVIQILGGGLGDSVLKASIVGVDDLLDTLSLAKLLKKKKRSKWIQKKTICFGDRLMTKKLIANTQSCSKESHQKEKKKGKTSAAGAASAPQTTAVTSPPNLLAAPMAFKEKGLRTPLVCSAKTKTDNSRMYW